MSSMSSKQFAGTSPRPGRGDLVIYGRLAAAVVGWLVAYSALPPVTSWLAYGLFGLPRGSHLGESVAFFLYDVPKILLLLSGMIFLISIVRTFFSPERTRALLGGKRQGIGNVLAAHAGHRHTLLLLLGGAAVHRLCRVGHPPGGDLLLPDRRADHQRGGRGDAVRALWLAGGRAVHCLGPDHRRHRRGDHRQAAAGALSSKSSSGRCRWRREAHRRR